MWAHYAGSHFGYCVEYERVESYVLSREPCKRVEYDDNPVEYTGDISQMRPAFFRKSAHWHYEKEWRILSMNPNTSLAKGTVIPSGVIFGLRTPTRAEDIIREIATSVRIGRIELIGGYEIGIRWE